VPILIRLGSAADVDAAVSVFERSNLARRHGVWPNRAAGVERVRAHLRDPASWFLVAKEGPVLVGMASAEALRSEGGAGPVTPGGCFLNFLFVAPERWGEGIGGVVLDAVLAEAKRRHYSRIHLWTQEDNERSHRLYRSRGFSPTGRTAEGEGEWVLEIPGRPTTGSVS
jgi:GNAT superfamily N-acetyltransferase